MTYSSQLVMPMTTEEEKKQHMDPDGDQNITHSHTQSVHKAANNIQRFDCKDTCGLRDAEQLYNSG